MCFCFVFIPFWILVSILVIALHWHYNKSLGSWRRGEQRKRWRREFFPWLYLELLLLRAVVSRVSDFLPLWVLPNDYNFKVESQNLSANSLILKMENPRPREMKWLGHGHKLSEILEIHRISIWRVFRGYVVFLLYILLTSLFIRTYSPKMMQILCRR